MDREAVRFDWYQATLEGSDDGRVTQHLALLLDAEQVRGKGRNGYGSAVELQRNGERLCTVYGRSARLGEVHVSVSGDPCDEVVPLVRRLWPRHTVSRADGALDFLADFDALDRHALAFADEKGISYRLVTDSQGGATRYVGSKTSEVMVRLYKKSEQMAAKFPEQAEHIPRGLVRAEVQVRPGKPAAKEAASLLPAADLWGFARWSRDLALLLLGFEAERTRTHFRVPTDDERALHFLRLQYRPTVDRLRVALGDERARGAVLEALWTEMVTDGVRPA